MNHYETDLPVGYTQVYRINAKEKRTALLLNGVGLAILAVVILPFLLPVGGWDSINLQGGNILLCYGIFFVGLLVYMVLHELVHGAAFKLLTHRKLTFGVSWSCAYCGVPDIYVYRKAMLIATLAPFVVFTIVLLPLTLAFSTHLIVYFPLSLLFASHVAGCVGDLFNTALMLFRFRNPKLLVRDTGPEQTFYLPEEA